MAAADLVTLHASCVSWRDRGVLLTGPSGAGKSDLALRLVDAGAVLVADDLVSLHAAATRLLARPVALPGLIELRGQGIYRTEGLAEARIDLFVRLGAAEVERLPPKGLAHRLLGIELPMIDLDARLPSAVARIRLALFGERVH